MQHSQAPPPQMSRRPVQQRSNTVPLRPTTNSSGESESWIEIPSNPSDTSSSDEHPIITSGLRITRRKRRNTFREQRLPSNVQAPIAVSDDDHSLSDDDEIAEDVASFIATQLSSSDFTTSSGATDDEDSSDDADPDHDGRTVFASSSSQPHRESAGTIRQSVRLGQNPSRERNDNDEALRASLSTLLSCAAAARGLPKQAGTASTTQPARPRATPGGAVEGLRVVREGDLPVPAAPACSPAATAESSSASPKTKSSSSASSTAAGAKKTSKRSSSSSRAKKVRDARLLNASLMTLALSAGAVIVFSAISFSAGYFVGRAEGRADMGASLFGGVGHGGRAVRRVGRVAG